LRKSKKPFYFDTSEYLISIGRETAANLFELLESLRRCPADSVFQHTFRTLQDSASRNADEPSRKTLVTSVSYSQQELSRTPSLGGITSLDKRITGRPLTN
jgi:hypothetical protein